MQEHKLALVEEVVKAMHLSSEEEMEGLRQVTPDNYTRQAAPISMCCISLNSQVLLPSLTCAVVSLGDRSRLEALQGYQADLSAGWH